MIEIYRDIVQIEAEWDALVVRTQSDIFHRARRLKLWEDAFAPGCFDYVTLSREGRVVAAAPVYRRGLFRLPARWAFAAVGPMAEDERSARSLIDAICDRYPEVSFGLRDDGGPIVVACRNAVLAAGWRVLERSLTRSPFIALTGDFQSFEKRLATGPHRSSDTRRRRRRLEEVGEVTVEVSGGEARFDELLEEGFALEASGWKGRNGTAIVCRSETRHFWTELARWAAVIGRLKLCFLRLDGRAIAFHLNFEDDGVVYHNKGCYDEALGRFSPSRLLHREMIASAYQRGLRRYEFLGEEEPYKIEWSTGSYDLLLLQAFAPTWAGTTAWSAMRYGWPLARTLRRSLRSLPQRTSAAVRLNTRG